MNESDNAIAQRSKNDIFSKKILWEYPYQLSIHIPEFGINNIYRVWTMNEEEESDGTSC